MLHSVIIFFNVWWYHFQEEDDANYDEEPEVADEFDSDFDEDVSIPLILFFLL